MSAQVPASLTEETVRRIADERDEPDWLRQRRLDALSALSDLDLPDVIQTPGRRWTNLAELDFESLVDPLDQRDETERVDAEGVEVLSFVEALDEHEAVLQTALGSVTPADTNYLTALSAALFTTGTFVYVPEGVAAEDVTIRTSVESDSLFGQTLVVAEESSSVTILERTSSEPSDAEHRYVSNVVEIVGGENSYVQ